MIENKSIGSKVFDVVNVVILILITLVCILPVITYQYEADSTNR